MSQLLEVSDLGVTYRADGDCVRGVSDVTFSVEPGEVVGLVGGSGSGKTTTMRAILGLLPPDAVTSGHARYRGEDLFGLPERRLRQLRGDELAFVPQAAMNSLDPVLRVKHQMVEAILAHRKISRSAAHEHAGDVLAQVGIDRARGSDYPHQFSGGMRQRVLIAMAIALNPRLLIADEPTTGLDVVVQNRIISLLHDLRSQMSVAMIVVTHDLGVAAEVCDRMIILHEGSPIESGTAVRIFKSPRHWYTRKLTQALAGEDSTDDPPPQDGPARLDVSNLDVRYAMGRGLARLSSRRFTAVEDFHLRLAPGEILGLAGESGCGKSSLAAALVGMADDVAGEIRIDGEPVRGGMKAWRTRRDCVQLIFQDPYQSLNPRFTVGRAVAEPLLANSSLGRDEIARRVDEALDLAELRPVEGFLHRLPHELSGGERQRVAIARALVVKPRILVADEPVSMLDFATGHEIADLLRRLGRDLAVSVLLISHDLSLLRRVCDRIAVMYLGRVVEQGATAEVLGHPRHPYTKALMAAVPSGDPSSRRIGAVLPGEPPSGLVRPSGCAFHPRCPRASAGQCDTNKPVLVGAIRKVACWNPHEDEHERGEGEVT